MKMTINMLLFLSGNNAPHRCAKAPQTEHYFYDLPLHNSHLIHKYAKGNNFYTNCLNYNKITHVSTLCVVRTNSLKLPLAIRKVPLALRKLP